MNKTNNSPYIPTPEGGGFTARHAKAKTEKAIDRVVGIDLLVSVYNSCQEGYSGDWDCDTNEGKEGFEAMQQSLVAGLRLLGINLPKEAKKIKLNLKEIQ